MFCLADDGGQTDKEAKVLLIREIVTEYTDAYSMLLSLVEQSKETCPKRVVEAMKIDTSK